MNDKSQGHFSIGNFFDDQIISGIIIIACIISAIIIANSPISNIYFNTINSNISISAGLINFTKPLKFWINEGLMTFFFLLIGFEIKRELIAGELSKFKKAVYPIMAALGGMIFPIIIFIALNFKEPTTLNGWGIPMSTDIAFVVSIMLLLGWRISKSLKISVTALAIIDDIGALIVIAFFYSSNIAPLYFTGIAIIIIIVMILNKLNIHSDMIYIFSGIILWFLFLLSGIQPTISGVLTAFIIPANTKINFIDFKKNISGLINNIDSSFLNREKHFEFADEESKKTFKKMDGIIKSVDPPLQRFEESLKPFVTFFIVPFFAFINSGILLWNISLEDLLSPLSLGIIIGLIVGKSSGIFLFSILSFKLKIAHKPENTSIKKIIGIGFLAGIGFTMSLFIAELSFTEEHLLNTAKLSIFIASLLSALIGILIFILSKEKRKI